MLSHSGKSATIRESNHVSDVCQENYAYHYFLKNSILLAGTGVWKISSVACGFSSIEIVILISEKFNQQNKYKTISCECFIAKLVVN